MTTAIGNEPFSIAVVITRGFTGLQRSAAWQLEVISAPRPAGCCCFIQESLINGGVLAAKILGESQENTGKTTISTINGGF